MIEAARKRIDTMDMSAPGQTRFGRRPRTLAETGLSESLILDLLVKHIHSAGTLTAQELSYRVALAGTIIEPLMDALRRQARAEIRTGTGGQRYALTDKGRTMALDALSRNGYVGPAPVPVADYARVAENQSIESKRVDRAAMRNAYADVVVSDALLDKLGPAVVSGRAIFIYGPAGTGKTYLTQRLRRLFDDTILVPYALAANDAIVELFDPLVHERVDSDEPASSVLLDQGHDPRFVTCRRPVVIAGGELTLDRLELADDPVARRVQASLQLKANNGLLIIDDLGRQRMSPMELLNRWIVPMEEREDFLSLGSGRHFRVPFDVTLIFSTNMNPLDLADEAFLRRIGHKIYFGYLTESEYGSIWRMECERRGVDFDPVVLQYVIEQLHGTEQVPLLPCHPRDLLGIAVEHARYDGATGPLDEERIKTAWNSYFVQLDGDTTDRRPANPNLRGPKDV